MKKIIILLVLTAASLFLFTSCGTVYTSETIAGEWFCQLGEDGGLLENEYTYELNSDGTYKFTYIYLVLGIQSTLSGSESGTWVYDESSTTLTLTPSAGTAYSFEITTLTSPATASDWDDLNNQLDSSGFIEGSDGIFRFDYRG